MSARIVVLAGANGGGKSSIGGEVLRQAGADYYNPDEVTRRLLERDTTLDQATANALAWQRGVDGLRRAIERRTTYAFETTLGGRSITELLIKASNVGLPVDIWYVGLSSPELHIARVKARHARGGHDIPEATIRCRYDSSRANLIRLLPHLRRLSIYDNSRDAPPDRDEPAPELLLLVQQGTIERICDPEGTPRWVKPILAAALHLFTR